MFVNAFVNAKTTRRSLFLLVVKIERNKVSLIMVNNKE